MLTSEELKTLAIGLEAKVAQDVGAQSEKVGRMPGGGALAVELVLTVAALFAARAVGHIYLWTGEPLPSVKARFFEAFDFNLGNTMRKMHAQTREK